MNYCNDYGYFNYPAEVLPGPVRRVIRFVILFNLTVLSVGAFLFGIYGGIQVVRGVAANPSACQMHSRNSSRHAHSPKGQRL